MKQGKWINVATVCRAARVLTPVVLSHWPRCPKRIYESCDKLISAGELAASTGVANHGDAALLESMTMLVGAFHLRSQGYEDRIPELWAGNADVRDSLPDSQELQAAIRNWIDTACRCTRTALDTTLDGAQTESQAGVSWTLCTLEELSAESSETELRSVLADLNQTLHGLPNIKNVTCTFGDGRWIIGRRTPWYRRWFN